MAKKFLEGQHFHIYRVIYNLRKHCCNWIEFCVDLDNVICTDLQPYWCLNWSHVYISLSHTQRQDLPEELTLTHMQEGFKHVKQFCVSMSINIVCQQFYLYLYIDIFITIYFPASQNIKYLFIFWHYNMQFNTIQRVQANRFMKICCVLALSKAQTCLIKMQLFYTVFVIYFNTATVLRKNTFVIHFAFHFVCTLLYLYVIDTNDKIKGITMLK